MNHWDEGRLLALADGELKAVEDAEHLAACETCRQALAALQADRALLRGALLGGDIPPPTERVRQALLARTHPSADDRSRPLVRRPRVAPGRAAWWARKSRLAQAALLVLLFAGGASALVLSSPIRGWLTGETRNEQGTLPPPMSAAPSPAGEVGTQVGPVDGRIDVTVMGLPSGSELLITLVEGESALVLGPAGTHFRSGNGRIEADASGGPLKIQLPRTLERVSLQVDGETYLTLSGRSVRLEVPAFRQSASEIGFRVP